MTSARFVAGLRTRAEAIVLAPDGAPRWALRVQLLDAWDAVRIDCTPDTRVDTVVAAALAALAGDAARPDDYDCKLRGVRIVPTAQSLRAAGALDGSTLLLVRAARAPAR
ncbi:MAG: hypothetical protein MUF00_03370 [Gemmatimonadaceae bacterium]|jgi:hypothetical protein|nr:hypothetical protein [Gemmatimonadaceae bacterium]